MPNLRQFQCAEALARHSHFGRAADAIGITQSGLTQNIQRLESHYGVELFVRDRGAIAPTVFGEVVINGARQVLDRVAAIDREVRLLNNLETGQLNVGVDPMLANSLLAPALNALLKAHPQLRFRVLSAGEEELLQKLAGHEVDLLLGFVRTPAEQNLRVIELSLPAPLVVGAPGHPLNAQAHPDLSEFLAYPLVQGPIAYWYLDWAERELKAEKTSVDLLEPYFLEATDTALLVRLARNSHALLAAMAEDVESALLAGELVQITPQNWPDRVPASIVWNPSRPQPPAAQRLIEEITSIAE